MTSNDIEVGDVIPALDIPAIKRSTLALYAGASGDHNPIHIDIDFARQAGFDDVFVHGMLNMGYLVRLVTNWRPQSALRKFSVRFLGIVQIHDEIHCAGQVRAIEEAGNERVAILDLTANNQSGTVVLKGEARVAI